jgi:hypothetical protein
MRFDEANLAFRGMMNLRAITRSEMSNCTHLVHRQTVALNPRVENDKLSV